jgi:hypothetical protein
MAYNKVYFHGAGPGIGDLMSVVDAAEIPFTIKSIKNEGFVLEALEYTSAAHNIIYRDPSPLGAGDDHPDLGLSPAEAAGEHWARFKLTMPDGIKDNRHRIWIEPTNEIDTNANAEWLGQFTYEYAKLTLAEEYNVLLSGHNAGQPEPEHWEMYFGPFLELTAQYPENIGVSLHEGKIDGDIRIPAWSDRWVPYLIGRYKFLHEACDRMGLDRPTVFISEWAWAPRDLPNDTMVQEDIMWLSEEVAKHPNIRGVCLWNLDKGWGGATKKLVRHIDYVKQLTLTVQWPDPPPVIPGFHIEDEIDSLPKHETRVYKERDLSKVSAIVIHHTVTPNTYDWVKRIATHHVSENGWPGIGYHYCITGDGRIIQTNHHKTKSYHSYMENHISLGVAMLGNFSSEHPTDEQIDAVNWLLEGELLVEFPTAEIVPHRQMEHSQTACPGATWEEWFDRIAFTPPEELTLEEFLWQDSEETQCISVNPDAALQSAIFGDGFTPVGTENWVVYDGKTYAYMAAELLDKSLPRRVYYALTPKWDEIVFTEDPFVTEPPPVIPPKYDMANYLWPEGEFGPIIILKNNWGANDERQQLQRGADGKSYVTKNSQWERRDVGFIPSRPGQYISLEMDTSPGRGEYYTFNGPWLPRLWEPGLPDFISEGLTVFHKKDDCSVVSSYVASSTLHFHTHYERYEIGDLVFEDVVVLEWIVDGGVDETYWYAAGVGLIRWLKYDGRESKAVEFIPVGQQENNVREVIPCAGD